MFVDGIAQDKELIQRQYEHGRRRNKQQNCGH